MTWKSLRNCLAVAAGVVCVFNGTFARADEPVAEVNIFQGTDANPKYSRGSSLPLVSEPWALTDWALQTHGDAGESRFFNPYSKHFAGIRGTHQPSPWNGDHGQVIFLPQTGPLVTSPTSRGAAYELIAAGPDAVKLRVPSQGMTIELTASARCAFMRITFDQGQTVGRFVLEPGDPGTMSVDTNVFHVTSSYKKLFAPDNYKVYYHAQLDRPITKSAIAAKDKPGYVEFDVSANPVVELRIGTSMIDDAQAARNAKTELAGGLEAVQQRTRKAWADQLNKFEIEGATAEERKTFYSSLYRVLKFPHRMDEYNEAGERVHYSAWDGKVHPGPEYTDNGLWDSYRSQFPLLSFAYPEQFADMIEGWLNAYREGGRLPNWPSPGGFNEMPGTHSNILVADAMVKGVEGFDYSTAYEALRKDSFVPPDGPFGGGRPHLKQMLELGYVSNEKNDSTVSDTLDYCYDDWAVGQAATVIGRTEDAKILEKRAQAYRNLWDPQVGFMRGKKPDGSWADEKFDEFAWMGPYCEGGPWQSSWAVQHDIAGLSNLLGGRAAMAKKLDTLFSLPPTFTTKNSPWGVIHEMTEMVGCDMGQCAISNQPSYHVPYMYAAVGQPWKTEYWTRKAVRTLFKSGPDGFPGDEDTGSAGAWYVLSAIGIFPLTPGHPSYVLTSPAFPKVTLHLPEGKKLVIEAKGNTEKTVYTQSRTVNGQPWTKTWISHADVMAGLTIVTEMSDKPNERPVAEEDLPYSASKGMP